MSSSTSSNQEITVRGPPLRPKQRNPESDPVLRYTLLAPKRKLRPRLVKRNMDGQECSPFELKTESLDSSLPATGTSPTLSNTLSLPTISRLYPAEFMPIRRWREYSAEESPMETVQSYIQDLLVIDGTIDEDKAQGTKSKLPLCPFILAHLQPSNRIIPNVPLTIPSCPAYTCYLLYVIKEAQCTHNDLMGYTAVFSIFRGNNMPTLIGAKTNYSFVEQVRSNIIKERERARRLVIEDGSRPFPFLLTDSRRGATPS